jgi:hypothetical protein
MDPPAKPAETFQQLRDRLFTQPLLQESDRAAEVHGVAMEHGVEGGSYLVFGLLDGTASVYLSSGGGFIGGQGKPHIASAARKLVEVARSLAGGWPLSSDHPTPAAGRVRFSIFTPAGVREVEVGEQELMDGKSELGLVFDAAQAIITGYRIAERKDGRDERGYLNCLLTALARGPGRPARLVSSDPPPDPASLTDDADDQKWIAGIGFQLDGLDTTRIIRALTALAKFPSMELERTEGRLQAKLANKDGSLSQVAFRVWRTMKDRRLEVEIEPDRRPA